MIEYIQAWQCIGCGKIEAPQPCIGVCKDKKVFLIGKNEHEAALAEIERLRGRIEQASAVLLRFERAEPREGQWERTWREMQAQVGTIRALLKT